MARLWLASQGGLPGQFRAPLQLHRGLDSLDALASRSDGLIERGLKPLIRLRPGARAHPARQSAALTPACSAVQGGSCDDCSSPPSVAIPYRRCPTSSLVGGPRGQPAAVSSPALVASADEGVPALTLRSLGAMRNLKMARTHMVSNQQASPNTLAKSTATCPKTMRYRNGFMRIGIWFA